MFDADFICFHIVGHIVLIFVRCFGFCWFSYSFGIWVWYFFLCFTPFVSVSVYVCLRHWIAYLRLLCFYVDITCVCFYLEGISLKHSIFSMLCLTAICYILDVWGFHCFYILIFYACSYLLWSNLCSPSLFLYCT